jgi:ABC-2 type transport system permease protein
VNVLTAVAIFAWGFHVTGRSPTGGDIALGALTMVAAVVILYSLWMLTVSAAFYVVRIDNLSQLFSAVFDAARWPVGIFPRIVRLIFTFVVPLALMTTVPAEALLGRLTPWQLAGSIAGAALAFAVSRAVWKVSIAKYTSAGG